MGTPVRARVEGIPPLNAVLFSVLPFLGILVALVVFHELGHYITAKMSGVKVLEFGVGFPPRLWAFRRGETEYSVNILPLGGFVRLLGEEDPTDPRSLAAQPAWRRLVVMGSGSFMNFILAISLFALTFMIPREVPEGRAVIAQVVPDSPAAQAGLRPGDIIHTIGGRDVTSVPDVSYNIRLRLGENTPITVARPDPATGLTEMHTIWVRPRWAPPPYTYTVQPGQDVQAVADATGFDRAAVRMAAAIDTSLPEGQALRIQHNGEVIEYTPQAGETVEAVARLLRVPDEAVAAAAGLPDPNRLEAGRELQFAQGATGIRIAPQYDFTTSRSYGPVEAFQRGWRATFDALKLARNELIAWARGGTTPAVSGPIGIAQTTGEVVREAGWRSIVDLAALLSINLAILNILPLPMLDGGRMTFVIIEILRRGRRIAPNKEAMVHLVGMGALLILVLVLSYFDIARIMRGDSIFR